MSKNVYHTRDAMYHYTKFIRDNKDIVILSGGKDSSIAIMNKKDYNKKIDEIINDGIHKENIKKLMIIF